MNDNHNVTVKLECIKAPAGNYGCRHTVVKQMTRRKYCGSSFNKLTSAVSIYFLYLPAIQSSVWPLVVDSVVVVRRVIVPFL